MKRKRQWIVTFIATNNPPDGMNFYSAVAIKKNITRLDPDMGVKVTKVSVRLIGDQR